MLVSSHSMEAILRHGDIDWEVECYISNKESPDGPRQYPDDIQALLQKHQQVFRDIPLGRPPDRGFEHVIELPEGSKIHNVFHVSCLKKAVGQQITTSTKLTPLDEEGQLTLIPKEILDVREQKLRNMSIREYLVKWKDLLIEDATWEGE